MSDLIAWVTESGAECLLQGEGPVRVMPHECEETGFTVELVAATEVSSLRADVDLLRDVLIRNGFVRCDTPACNCGSWHARFGLLERLAEVKQLLEDSGHGLCNENGNLVSRALSALIAERDALIAALHAAGGALDAARKAVRA